MGRVLFSRIDSATNRVYLATDQNVLAALNLKTGNIGISFLSFFSLDLIIFKTMNENVEKCGAKYLKQMTMAE